MSDVFFSPLTGGFYSEKVHGDRIPPDSLKISKKKHAELIEGLARGLSIVIEPGGLPALVAATALGPLTKAEVEIARLHAYSHPVTGSDRHFAEAQRERLLGNEEAAMAAMQIGLSRFAEIQDAHPWPAQ